METLDFSCSSRKREEVDGKALASDKTLLSSFYLPLSLSFFLFLSFTFLPPDRVILFSSCTSVFFIAAKRDAFLSHIQILCEEKFDPLSKMQRLTAAKKNVDSMSKGV